MFKTLKIFLHMVLIAVDGKFVRVNNDVGLKLYPGLQCILPLWSRFCHCCQDDFIYYREMKILAVYKAREILIS